MKRREFLKASGSLSAQLFIGGTLLSAGNAKKAQTETGLPLTQLSAAIEPSQALIVLPGSAKYNEYNTSFNKRMQLAPKVRVVANHAQGVQSALAWAVQNNLTFAVRGGGHSYEGFSQSTNLVIDVRGLNTIEVDTVKNLATIGTGTSLGQVYTELSAHKLAIPAGSCFPVGVPGHTLGGGFGLLGRAFGLACDSVESMQMVDAAGQLRSLSAVEDADLFWAVRGGGNGNFGVVTQIVFRTHTVEKIVTFGLTWDLTVEQGVPVVQAWQDWLTTLPDSVTCTLHMNKGLAGKVRIHLAGWCVDSETALRVELDRLQKETGVSSNQWVSTYDFIDAAHHFNGDTSTYQSVYMKAKSDYVRTAMSPNGIKTLLQGILQAPRPIAVMADSYGGAINRIPRDATAFVHRGGTLYSLQYYMEWSDPTQSATNIAIMRTLYAAMRPFVSGECYVNYCDLDLPDYPKAYWAENLPRLSQLKGLYDPNNVFKHAQSVPLILD